MLAMMEKVLAYLDSVSEKNLLIMLATLYVPSGLSKLVPGLMTSMWPTLPKWSWLVMGVWELAAVYTYYTGNLDLTFKLLGLFMGGVVFAVSRLPHGGKPSPAVRQVGVGMLLPWVYGSTLVYMVGSRSGYDLRANLLCQLGGYVFGKYILAPLGNPYASKEKK